MKKMFLSIVFVLTVSISYAQKTNAAADFKLMNETYKKHKNLSFDITYNYYPSYQSTVATESKKGFYKKQNKNILSKIDEFETLVVPDYLLLIDNENQKIIVGNPLKNTDNQITMVAMDSMLALCSSVTISENKNQKIYKLDVSKFRLSEYNFLEIYLNKKSRFIDKMVFYFKEKVPVVQNDKNSIKDKPRLEILYENINTDSHISQEKISEKKYIKKLFNGKIELADPFKNYQLINQTS